MNVALEMILVSIKVSLHVTYFRQACGYFPSCRASPPCDRYQITLLVERVWQVCEQLEHENGMARNL